MSIIRKFAAVEGPVAVVRDMFADAKNWTQWMPGVTSVDVVEKSEGYSRVSLTQHYRGKKFDQLMDVRYDSTGMKQKQLTGWFKKWEANWRFQPPPSGDGTTVSCDLDLEMGGMAGLFAPRHLVQELVDGLFDEIIRNARRQTRKLVMKGKPAAEADRESQTLLQVFQTNAGLEVWVAGKKYELKSKK